MEFGHETTWVVIGGLALTAVRFFYVSCTVTGMRSGAGVSTSTEPVRITRRLLALASLLAAGFAVHLIWGALLTLRNEEPLSAVNLVAAVLITAMAGVSWHRWPRVQVTLDTMDGSCRVAARLATKADTLVGRVTIDDLDLTPRQQEVVELICSGIVSDAAIGEALVISPHTAGTHVRNILGKSNLSSRRDLMLLGLAEPHVAETSGAG